MLIPVILSGGSGTRLWPLSRELYPKQLLPLVNDRTMIQDTALRLVGLAGVATRRWSSATEQQRFMVAEQLRLVGIQPKAILLEPVGRNTAPAVALAALVAGSEVPGTGLAPSVARPVPRTSSDDPLLLVLGERVRRPVRHLCSK